MNVLLVSTTASWLAQARMPRALATAGFRVSLLAPPDSLGAQSRFVARFLTLPADANRLQWEIAFAAAVEATAPRLVVPCDDMATYLMQALAVAPSPALPSASALALATLVRDSLGDPAHYRSSVDKTLLPQAAAAAGVSIPETTVVDRVDAAIAFAASHRYPAVLKRGRGFAGQAVAIVADEAELVAAFARLSAVKPTFPGEDAGTIVVQPFLPGVSVSRACVSWARAELAGVTRERVTRHPEHTGPGSTVRIYCDPRVREASQALARALDLRGFWSSEYIVDPDTGKAYLLEMNRRAIPGHSLGTFVGVDLGAALAAALAERPRAGPGDVAPGYEKLIAQFPQEWMRDARSDYLRDAVSDAPWDDPAVFEAILALRHSE